MKNATALRDLPLVADAAMAGRMGAAHVQVFAYGLKHVGLDSMREFEEAFVQVALDHEPAALFEAVKHLKDVVHPEELDPSGSRGWTKKTSRSTPSLTAGT